VRIRMHCTLKQRKWHEGPLLPLLIDWWLLAASSTNHHCQFVMPWLRNFQTPLSGNWLMFCLATEHHAKAKHECSTSAMKQDLSIRLHFLIWSLYFQAGMKMRDPTCIRILLYLSSSAYVNLSCHGWENSTFASVSIVFMKTMCFFFS